MVASALSVLLLLSTVLPLIQQACCDEIASQLAEPPCHDMADTMPDRPGDAMQSPMNHAGVQDDCCVIQSAPTPILPSLLLKEAVPLPVLHPVLLALSTPRQPAPTAQPPLILADASPLAAPLPLHLLNGSFLN